MKEQLFEAFSKLSVSDKRNEINSEMEKVFEILKRLMQTTNIPIATNNISNYDQSKDSDISESDYLNNIYKDFMSIRELIINYITWKK